MKNDKILIDTGAWVDFLGAQDGKLGDLVAQAIVADQATLCGVVIAELVQGAMGEVEQQKLDLLFSQIESLKVNESMMLQAGMQLQQLSKQGVELPLSYALIAVIAKENNVRLLTADTNFSHFDVDTIAP